MAWFKTIDDTNKIRLSGNTLVEFLWWVTISTGAVNQRRRNRTITRRVWIGIDIEEADNIIVELSREANVTDVHYEKRPAGSCDIFQTIETYTEWVTP